jgi:peptidyl-prolyl cis-trans isomerase C
MKRHFALQVVSACLLGLSAQTATLAQTPAVLMSGPDAQVTVDDIKAEYSRMPEVLRAKVATDPASLKQLVENIYIRRTAAAVGQKRLEASDPILRYAVQTTYERLLADVAFEVSDAQGRLSDAQALEYAQTTYKADVDRFLDTPEVTLRQIFFSGATADEQCTIRPTAQQVLTNLRNGADFAEQARQHSTDTTTATNGGLLGPVAPGTLLSEVAAAVSKLTKPNAQSGLIQTSNGIYIIKLEERHKGKPKSFEAVKDALIKEAQQRAASDARGKEVQRIISTAQGDQTELEKLMDQLKSSRK